MTAAKSLPLILARELAANLATPTFLIDADAMLVYYNDAAEQLVGQPFTGEVPIVEWGGELDLETETGERLPRTRTPPGVALIERRPAHSRLTARGFDGVRRVVEITAYPLFAGRDTFEGVLAHFWEPNGDDG